MITEEVYKKALHIIKLYESEQLLIHNVSGRSEQLANFCTCKKPWGVGGRCVACEMPIKIG